jgi:trans-2,3-dihydro-3-hydroxyanthranilate isomerase
MTTRDFLIVDVFTGNPLEGNQLGVFTDSRGLSDDLMLKATRELNFSETVFFLKPDDPQRADVHIRIFTPAAEIPFAGHPTLGSAWALAEALDKDAVTIQTKAGLVPVALDRDPATREIVFGRMEQPIPRIEPLDNSSKLLEALGTAPKASPTETYTNGPSNVYVEFADEETVANLDPDMQKLARIPLNVSCYAQVGEAGTGKATWVTRMFAPALGVTEDPATGSAAGPLAVHLARQGRIGFGEEIEIRQGDYIHRPSVLYASAHGTPDAIGKVVVGGRAVVVARGEYRLT